MTTIDLEKVRGLISKCSTEERHEMFRMLRREFPIHSLETKLNTTAEIILEAIDRSSDLTLRGIRGVIAEAAFKENIVIPLEAKAWKDIVIDGNPSYDFHLEAPSGLKAKIQVKMQRQRAHQPMHAAEASRRLFREASNMWVVETQKTRGGKDSEGNSTRPYRYGDFDILAVSLHPSSNDWGKFRYTVTNWLIPDPTDSERIFKYQPIPMDANDDWTDTLETCFEWLEKGEKKTIRTT